MNRYLLDTNLLVRFLTGEPVAQAAKARDVIARADRGELVLRLTSLVVAETVFVLTGKVYGFAREEVADALIPFLQTPALEVENRAILIAALRLFRQHPLDFVDACLAAEAAAAASGIASFDRDFDRIPGLQRLPL